MTIPDFQLCDDTSSGSDPIGCKLEMSERIISRESQSSAEGDRWTLRCTVYGTMNECLVRDRIRDAELGIPPQVHGVTISDYSVRNMGWMYWAVEAYYGYTPLGRSRDFLTNRLAYTPSSFDFSTMGGTTTLTAALVNEYASDGAPDVGTAIEWDGKRIKGLATPVSRQRWAETWKFQIAEVFQRPGYIAPLPDSLSETDVWELRDLSLYERWDAMGGVVHGVDRFYDPAGWTKPTSTNGRTDSAWREFNEGEAKFLGATARKIDDHHMQVTFQFEVVRNRWFDVPPSITLSVSPEQYPWRRTNPQDSSRWQLWKYGFDHMQVFYEKSDKPEASNGDIVIDEAKSVIVQQTIQRIPFHYLGVPAYQIINQDTPGRPPSVCQKIREFDEAAAILCGS